jgi:Domain of unknown function (DUF222)
MCSIQLPELADLDGLAPRQLAVVLAELDGVRRQVDALIAETVGVADRTAAYAEDGHATVSGWATATYNWSRSDARAAVQCSRLLHAIPEVRAAAHAATLGGAQVRMLGQLFANPRCASQLPDSAVLLVGHAASLPFDDFVVVARRWEALADADGAHRAHQRAHDHRDAHVTILAETVRVDAHGGIPAGAVIEEIFARFCDAEFHTDWDTGFAQWGERMNPSRLDRTAAQRRFDALLAIFTTAAASGVVGDAGLLVNIHADQTTIDYHLARLAGTNPAPLDKKLVDGRRCETSTGHQIDPDDMLAALLTGHVRRVMFNSAGVVIDLGRRSRLFTGGSRDAVLLADRHCLWPGCDLASTRTQTDHTTPWAASDGPTSPDNGGPLCARHNRWKHHGYKTWRDPNGHWHTQRPDGTEIGPLHAPHPNPAANANAP